MAQLLIIKAETAKDGLQYIGDVVGIFLDSHVFSGTELAVFDVLTVGGSVEDVQARLDQIKPRIEEAHLWESDNKYHWLRPEAGACLESIDVYRLEGGIKWYKAENDFKFPINVGELTATEKQLLETIDINNPSVDSFIRKIVKDIAALSGNDVEVKELRNSEP